MAYNWGRSNQDRFYSGRHDSQVTYDLYWRSRHEKERKFMEKLMEAPKPKMPPGIRGKGFGARAAGRQAEQDFVRRLQAAGGDFSEPQPVTWPVHKGRGQQQDEMPTKSKLGAIKAKPKGKRAGAKPQPLQQQAFPETDLGGHSATLVHEPAVATRGGVGLEEDDVDDFEITNLRQQVARLQKKKQAEKEKRQKRMQEKRRLQEQIHNLQAQLNDYDE